MFFFYISNIFNEKEKCKVQVCLFVYCYPEITSENLVFFTHK